MADLRASNIIRSIFSGRDSANRRFRSIINKLQSMYEGARHRDVETVESVRDELRRENRDMNQTIEVLIYDMMCLVNYDCAAGSFHCEEVRDDAFGHDWNEDIYIFYTAAEELNKWLCQAESENDERAKMLIEDCFEILNHTITTLEKVGNGGSIARVEICYPAPVYITNIINNTNITNMGKTERHFHFNDKVTYIEHQEITVQAGAVFNNGPSNAIENSIEDAEIEKIPLNSNEGENEDENSNANLHSALHDLVEKGAALVLPDFLERYRAFWKRVLADEDFIAAFKVQAPHGFYGGYNKKLFCNILGFLKEKNFFAVRSSEVLGKQFYENAVKKYINNFGPRNGGTDTSLTETLLQKLQVFV